jgi:transcriptional regulator with XRE-family HTH domain
MGRRELRSSDRVHGRRLGAQLAKERNRAKLAAQDVAVSADLSVDTVRSLESGRVPTPAFITVARIADALSLSLDDLHRAAQAGTRSRKSARSGRSA